MGQYYVICNLDKKEYLSPHAFGEGAKLTEFGYGGLTLTALSLLLASGNGRGGGDFPSESSVIGKWAGDRVIVAGDYADQVPGTGGCNIYDQAHQDFKDISEQMLSVLELDSFLKKDVAKVRRRFPRNPVS